MKKTNLSVNINKLATIRNTRESDNPNLLYYVKLLESLGVHGITVHPRQDQRHIKYSDLLPLKKTITTEFNIEGYPSNEFMDLVLQVKPDQVTLVPDDPNVLTSNEGWNIIKNKAKLSDIVSQLNDNDIRTSIFIEPDIKMIEAAKNIGANRIELYTKHYADAYTISPEKAIKPYVECSILAKEIGIEVNAGHDLNSENLNYFKNKLVLLNEVSIGHAFICDALLDGIKKTTKKYLQALH
jgi:pyridoxine 5-phosphate synthase